MSVFTKSSHVHGNLNPPGQTHKPVKELGLFFRCHVELRTKSESPFLISLFNSKTTQRIVLFHHTGYFSFYLFFFPLSLSG